MKCKKSKKNPVTQMMEPYIPSWSKISRKASSLTVVFFMVGVTSCMRDC